MDHEHKHEYVVKTLSIATVKQREHVGQVMQDLFDNGWLPAGGFGSIASLPKDHMTLFLIFARDKR